MSKGVDGVGHDEGSFEIGRTGRRLVFPDGRFDCTYIRIIDKNDREVAYWESGEWAEEPEEVMGAIMGAAQHGDSRQASE